MLARMKHRPATWARQIAGPSARQRSVGSDAWKTSQPPTSHIAPVPIPKGSKKVAGGLSAANTTGTQRPQSELLSSGRIKPGVNHPSDSADGVTPGRSNVQPHNRFSFWRLCRQNENQARSASLRNLGLRLASQSDPRIYAATASQFEYRLATERPCHHRWRAFPRNFATPWQTSDLATNWPNPDRLENRRQQNTSNGNARSPC